MTVQPRSIIEQALQEGLRPQPRLCTRQPFAGEPQPGAIGVLRPLDRGERDAAAGDRHDLAAIRTFSAIIDDDRAAPPGVALAVDLRQQIPARAPPHVQVTQRGETRALGRQKGDAQGRLTFANAAFCRQSGLGMKEVLSSPCYASSHGRDQPCVPTLVGCPLYELDRHQEPVKYSHIHLDRGRGKNFAAEVFAAPLKSALPGHPRLVVESIRNLTQQVEVTHEQRLSELGQLAAGVAHEIHNPLASIRLGVHAIQRAVENGESGTETREYMSAVNTELDRCLKVTEKLMRLSRLPDERGVLIDLAVVVRDVMTLLRYEAELLQIRMTLTAAVDVRIIASEPDLGMVMINLMQNAFHAMPKGGCLSLDIARNEARDVIVTVGDTGVGIEPSHLPLIFHPFWSWRADGSAGSGLGLAICKSSVAKWGGRIEVRSEVGVGTTFVLTFPHANKTLDV